MNDIEVTHEEDEAFDLITEQMARRIDDLEAEKRMLAEENERLRKGGET